ncbi:hypothetical protein ACHAXS_013735 [Conticribra weissflogii]
MKMMYQMDAKEMEDRLKEDVSEIIVIVVSCFGFIGFVYFVLLFMITTDCLLACFLPACLILSLESLIFYKQIHANNDQKFKYQPQISRPTQKPNYVPTLEDEIESQRQKKLAELKASGKKGTPVTEATFKEWQERKRKRKEAQAKKLVEAEMKKKKGGKGLSILSGRELYNYKKELFRDMDDDGDDVVGGDGGEEKKEGENGKSGGEVAAIGVDKVAEKVEKDLFLDGADDDLDDIEDDD